MSVKPSEPLLPKEGNDANYAAIPAFVPSGSSLFHVSTRGFNRGRKVSAWTAFGLGVLIGALTFDQLWRHVRRLERRPTSLRGEIGYYTKADVDAAWERVRHVNFEPPEAERLDTADDWDARERTMQKIERAFYENHRLR